MAPTCDRPGQHEQRSCGVMCHSLHGRGVGDADEALAAGGEACAMQAGGAWHKLHSCGRLILCSIVRAQRLSSFKLKI